MDILPSTVANTKTGTDYVPASKPPVAEQPVKVAREIAAEPSAAERMLRAQISAQGLPLPEEGEGYNPRHVADRILGFIRERVERAAPDVQQQLLADARAGVEQGLRDAEAALQAANLLEDAADDIAATRARLFDNLDAYAKELRTAAAQAQSEAPVTERSLATTQSGTAQNASVQIKTRDGDLVNVNFARVSASAQVSAAASGGFGNVEGSAKASLSAVRIEYSVEGELDAREQKAVDRLLRRVDNIAAHFFDGQLQAAFSQASNLGVNGKQLAEFSFSLEQRSVLKAMSEYQTVSNGDKPAAPAGGAQALGEYVSELRDLFKRPDPGGLLEIPKTDLAALLDNDINERSLTAFGNDLAEGALSLLKDLISHLLSEADEDEMVAKDTDAQQPVKATENAADAGSTKTELFEPTEKV